MARKNIAVQTDVDYAGDFAPLKDSLEQITSELNNVMSGIKGSVQQVAAGADQVAAGAQTLASGSTEQASAVEEVFAALNNISEETQKTAANAEDARRITQESASSVREGNLKMQDMIRSMDHIYTTSNEISKIIKTIDDIAIQTNILALNASVEAARAARSARALRGCRRGEEPGDQERRGG
jgi:methyl-accepting chemotaxis protein